MDNELEYFDEPEKDRDEGAVNANQEPAKPAGAKEWLLRAGGMANIAMQAVNISLTYSKGAALKVWQGQNATLQAGQACTYASSGLGIVNSPVVIYKERQLTKEDTFRAALNGIREQQGRLSEQNDILSAEIDDLESEVRRMQDIEMALKELSEVQGTQINELLDLVRQNKEINEGMRHVLKNKVLEEVISLVLDIDNDGSFTIQNNEIDRLIIGMNLIDEIKFDAQAFRTDVIACGGNVDEVIMIIKRMIHGSSEGEVGRETACQIEIEDPENWFQKQKGGGSVSGRR
eukprot:CCRYP_011479-RB/>CCRYP_011479-RB protein AED:0.12 eAED:0.12 QI:211/1/1/1/0.8/0.66/6/374/288